METEEGGLPGLPEASEPIFYLFVPYPNCQRRRSFYLGAFTLSLRSNAREKKFAFILMARSGGTTLVVQCHKTSLKQCMFMPVSFAFPLRSFLSFPLLSFGVSIAMMHPRLQCNNASHRSSDTDATFHAIVRQNIFFLTNFCSRVVVSFSTKIIKDFSPKF